MTPWCRSCGYKILSVREMSKFNPRPSRRPEEWIPSVLSPSISCICSSEVVMVTRLEHLVRTSGRSQSRRRVSNRASGFCRQNLDGFVQRYCANRECEPLQQAKRILSYITLHQCPRESYRTFHIESLAVFQLGGGGTGTFVGHPTDRHTHRSLVVRLVRIRIGEQTSRSPSHSVLHRQSTWSQSAFFSSAEHI